MVFIEAATGKPIVKTNSQQPLEPHLVVAKLMRSLGTPSHSALRVLDPSTVPDASARVILRPPLAKLLGTRATKARSATLLGAMIDWNPATRASAVSLLCQRLFRVTAARGSPIACELTDAELYGIISLAFTAHVSRVDAELPLEPSEPAPHICIPLAPIQEDGDRASVRPSLSDFEADSESIFSCNSAHGFPQASEPPPGRATAQGHGRFQFHRP
jgi:hypothetical protein